MDEQAILRKKSFRQKQEGFLRGQSFKEERQNSKRKKVMFSKEVILYQLHKTYQFYKILGETLKPLLAYLLHNYA